ncbi:type I phosphomannose isomerase catalytic subunit [Thermosipho atlanticus]|uniref:Mannose-6-phosphate isomerase, type 1 n=1 Tax=Thermosipho atlanticus DSM 15807 TaxID=1123380 RepID=A0A1M5R3L1_9BACT|nr:type I phosphomannose isomerase catalytic subunit [Thermosipho atlanticus]SHH20997.1 mannose-6-phosphate isomerase, type 1 [Thermosipho atlanticus DSM 15807]
MIVKPFFRRMVWGNPKLNEIFQLDGEPIGEIWLVSGHPLYTTEIAGKKINEVSDTLCGKKFNRFPLLVKLISSASWLSVQVHPDDEYARTVENEPWGKNEAWYFLTDGVIAICEDPSLISTAMKEGNWNEVLKIEKVSAGTFVNIPAGTIHALGPNSTVIEVQQSSDLTYRIYDWGRPRETHIKKALEVSKSVKFEDLIVNKINTKYFEMREVTREIVDGFSIIVPKEINKDFGARIISIGEKEEIENSILIKLGEFFLNS